MYLLFDNYKNHYNKYKYHINICNDVLDASPESSFFPNSSV